jgi:hypothetical protein
MINLNFFIVCSLHELPALIVARAMPGKKDQLTISSLELADLIKNYRLESPFLAPRFPSSAVIINSGRKMAC